MAEPSPDSFFDTPRGRVELKVHRCIWSGAFSDNSPLAIAECGRERVLRAEIDVQLTADGVFVVFHDDELDTVTDATGPVRLATAATVTRARYRDGSHPLTLAEAAALLASQEYPRTVELDLKEEEPYGWREAEALVRAIEPARDCFVLGGVADWNIRRLLRVDPTLRAGLNPHAYIDVEGGHLPEGAYGYRDAHPLARARLSETGAYLRDRLGGIMRLVPGAAEAHLRLSFFERMLDDGVADAAAIFHELGIAIDVWTLDADTPRWRERLARAVAGGADIVTTNTPARIARAGRELVAAGAAPGYAGGRSASGPAAR